MDSGRTASSDRVTNGRYRENYGDRLPVVSTRTFERIVGFEFGTMGICTRVAFSLEEHDDSGIQSSIGLGSVQEGAATRPAVERGGTSNLESP